MLVGDAVCETARTAPARPAIVQGALVVTYGKLGEQIQRIASALQREHPELTGRGEHLVALQLEDPVAFLAAFLGSVRAGAVAAPFSTGWAAAQTESARTLARPLAVIDDAKLRRLLEVEFTEALPRRGSASAAFYAGFTSGSTGEPRAVVRSHEAWVRSFEAMSAAFGIPDGARVLVPGSLFFSFSLIAALHALHIGGTVVVPAESGPRGLAAALDDGADAVHVLPSVLHETLVLASRRGQRYEGVRRIICAGEALSGATRDLVAQCCPDAELFEYYGASELGFVTVLRPEDAAAHPGSVGRAFPGTEVTVLDERGEAVPAGEVGPLCARTPYGGLRYLGGEDLDVALDHHGWRTVGDLARQDAAGFVTLAGRRDRMVVIRGENVYPEETERALASMPGVVRAAAVAVPSERPTHLVAAVQGASDVDVGAILERCREVLAARNRPRRIVVVEELPVTGTGKVDYARLEAFFGR